MYGLYLEGARWDTEEHCLKRSHPKVLIQQLPILNIVPTEVHRLKLQVSRIRLSISISTVRNCYLKYLACCRIHVESNDLRPFPNN